MIARKLRWLRALAGALARIGADPAPDPRGNPLWSAGRTVIA